MICPILSNIKETITILSNIFPYFVDFWGIRYTPLSNESLPVPSIAGARFFFNKEITRCSVTMLVCDMAELHQQEENIMPTI